MTDNQIARLKRIIEAIFPMRKKNCAEYRERIKGLRKLREEKEMTLIMGLNHDQIEQRLYELERSYKIQ